jgi:hypothetical protein
MENNIIKISKDSSPIGVETNLKRYHFSFLIPDQTIPFSAYIFFKGKYLEIVKKNGVVPLALMAKMFEAENFFFFILESESHLFDIWVHERQSFKSKPFANLDEKKRKFENRLARYTKESSGCLEFSEDNVTTRALLKSAEAQLRRVISHGSMKWYFEKEWDPSFEEVTGRITFNILLFLEWIPEIKKKVDIFSLTYAAIIHKMDGDLKTFPNPERSKQITDFLRKNKIIITEDVAKIISNQNEYHNGEGPKGLKEKDIPLENRILNLIEYFDNCRRSITGKTKSKAIEDAILNLAMNKHLFNPLILKNYYEFNKLIVYLK